MGSPASKLNIPEALRPWHSMGLEFLLSSGPVAVQPVVARPVQGASAVAGQGDSVPHQPQQPARQPVSTQPANANNMPPRAGSAQSPSNGTSNAAPHAAANTAPASAAGEMRQPPAPSSAPLPAPWDRFASMVRSAKPRVLLTYPELGFDLTGQADKARGQLMRTLLSYLKWPTGTAAFWPCALPVDGVLQPQYDMFWRGVHHFRCQHVVCFGMQAMRTVVPDFPQGTTTVLLEPCALHLAPSVADLLGKLPHELLLSLGDVAELRV